MADAVSYNLCNVVSLSGPVKQVDNVNQCFFLGVMLVLISKVFVNEFDELSAEISNWNVWFAFVPKDVVTEFPISGLIEAGV